MKPVIMRAGLAGLALVLAQSFAFGETVTPRRSVHDTGLRALQAERACDPVTVELLPG